MTELKMVLRVFHCNGAGIYIVHMRELIPGAFHLPLGNGSGSTWPGGSP